MRRRVLTIFLAALVLAVVVPIGAALTLDRRLPLSARPFKRAVASAPTLAVTGRSTLPETGALALTGGMLIGLAAAVRRIV